MEPQIKTFKKGEMLLVHGQMPNYAYRVIKGCLRSYVVDKAGKEHIMQFAPENWIISDINSMINSIPSTIFIDAIEDTEAMLFTKQMFEEFNNASREELIRQRVTLVNNIIALNKRLTLLLASTAEERYLDFIETYPTLMQRLPLKLIASFIGVTPEYLSETRRKLAKK
jgi:CRP/FNR family transcriptional regulator, anaerobic regulatory protein